MVVLLWQAVDMDDLLLEPLKYYEKVGKEEHKQNTEDFFENLLKS